MQGEKTQTPTREVLLKALDEAGNDKLRVVAVLWTWLEPHLQQLGSRREKLPAIRKTAFKAPKFEGIDQEILSWVLDNPPRNAAELLARIGRDRSQVKTPVAAVYPGYDGSEVVVADRVSDVITSMSPEALPPSALEHPSLTTLAPTLVVSPVKYNGIELEILPTVGRTWDAVKRKMDRGRASAAEGHPPTFEVHLDPLGDHGRSGLTLEADDERCRYDPVEIEDDDERECAEAAAEAVERASGPSSILVMPELAATPPVMQAVRDAIAAQVEPPALTAIGEYHLPAAERKPAEPFPADDLAAPLVNEAVALGPNGKELWRHQKLCSAGGEVPPGKYVIEDIQLGVKFRIVSLPIGNVAMAICLDSFQEQARERIARSPANVLLVPSLSEKLHRHRDSLQHMVQRLWGVAFVCNRSPDPAATGSGVWDADDNRSFWVLQRKNIAVFAAKAPGEHPSFVFRLAEHLKSPKEP